VKRPLDSRPSVQGAAPKSAAYDPACADCPRLARFLADVGRAHPDYFARPVPSFGSTPAGFLVVGLAPGMHGANRTGRPFTGDYAGILLYRTLHKFGFASHAGSDDPGDGLRLQGCRVTNAVKCLPPQNKPEAVEVRRCNRFLAAELSAVRPRAILALGTVAHRAVLMAMGLKAADYPFLHHAVHAIPTAFDDAAPADAATAAADCRLYDSYHCSRYNTQTRRLSAAMFEAVVGDIEAFLST